MTNKFLLCLNILFSYSFDKENVFGIRTATPKLNNTIPAMNVVQTTSAHVKHDAKGKQIILLSLLISFLFIKIYHNVALASH